VSVLVNNQTRRQFLRGLGGFALAVPFMPSLAHAQARPPRRFVALTTPHGGIWGRHMYPSDALLTEQTAFAGHTIRHGRLRAVRDGIARLSPVLSAQTLDDGLLNKINVLRGLDVPYYLAHHRGGHLGNFADNDGNGAEGAFVQSWARPTIDQVMAWSPGFYDDLSTNRLRSIIVGQRGLSWNWSRPSDRSGRVQPMAPEHDPLPLFNRLFRPGADTRTPSPLVVDRVNASYRRLMQSNPRISVADRRRLTEHMDRLSELERRLRIDVQCDGPEPNWRAGISLRGDAQSQLDFWRAHVDIIVAALACGVSRVGVLGAYSTFSDFAGDWHQDIAHQGHLPDQQSTLVQSHQRCFEHVFLDLARKLDAVDEGDGTLLDNSLIAWTQESGLITHDSYGIPLVTAGGAGGAMQTGRYVDYRNADIGWDVGEGGGAQDEQTRPGLYYNQWLGTALGAMGVQTAEYAQYSRDLTADYAGERPGGYGVVYTSESSRQHYAQAWQVMGDRLPIIAG
jgi:hypothetical protein